MSIMVLVKMSPLLYVFSIIVVAQCTNVIRPRGVSLARGSLYDPAKPFVCFDGSSKIPYEYINDDYCDCKDGSDEPGTSACINGSFYCNNIGHQSKKIPSSWVNDAVCDCCDTSDEYGSNANCINNCEELGEVARKEAEILEREQLKGYDIRQLMAEEGLQMKKDKQARLSELENEKKLAEDARLEKLAIKDLMEAPEKEALEKYKEAEEELKRIKEEEERAQDELEAKEAFNYLDSNADGVINSDELRSRSIFDTNKDGEVSEAEIMIYLNQEESVDIDTFMKSSWTLIKPVYRYGRNMFIPPTNDAPVEGENTPDNNVEEEAENLMDANDYEETEEQDETTDEYAEEFEEEETSSQADTKDAATPEDTVQYDEETQKLVDAANAARVEYNLEDKKVRDIISEMKVIENEFQKDYGPNEEFRPLAGKCFEFNEREYTYKLCPFDYVSQKQRNGHSETRLGTWGEWAGPENSLYSAMKYIGGQGCWNGPQRSTEVQLSCSTENVITAVSEPNRCEYLFLFSSPSVCTQPSKTESVHEHIEL